MNNTIVLQGIRNGPALDYAIVQQPQQLISPEFWTFLDNFAVQILLMGLALLCLILLVLAFSWVSGIIEDWKNGNKKL